ncbi:MAG: hypothetical protein U1F18_07250 [Steroidobacteraceae bacterium]
MLDEVQHLEVQHARQPSPGRLRIAGGERLLRGVVQRLAAHLAAPRGIRLGLQRRHQSRLVRPAEQVPPQRRGPMLAQRGIDCGIARLVRQAATASREQRQHLPVPGEPARLARLASRRLDGLELARLACRLLAQLAGQRRGAPDGVGPALRAEV